MEIPRTVTYNVQIEEGPKSFGAQVLELPGCFAVAPTREEVMSRIHVACKMGDYIPPTLLQPRSSEIGNIMANRGSRVNSRPCQQLEVLPGLRPVASHNIRRQILGLNFLDDLSAP